MIRNTIFDDLNKIRSKIYDIKNDLYDILNSDSCNFFTKCLSLATIDKAGTIWDALEGYGYYKFITNLNIFKTMDS